MSDANDDAGNGDENDGAEAEAAAAAAENNAGDAGDGGEGGKETSPAYRPEGLADDFAGETDQETIDKLLAGVTEATKRADGLRKKLGEGVPKSADEYPELSFSEDFVSKHGNPAPKDDPVLDIVKSKAMEAGISAEAYNGFVTGVLEAAAEKGLLEAPFDPNAEFEKAGGKEAYERRMHALDQRLDGLVSQEKLTADQRELAKAFQATADGMGLFEAIFGLASEKGVQLDGDASPGSGSVRSLDDVKKRMDDPRYDSTSKDFDPEFVAETRRMFDKLSQ
jgi:hypothetical protein